jgi:hypothetical protein
MRENEDFNVPGERARAHRAAEKELRLRKAEKKRRKRDLERRAA